MTLSSTPTVARPRSDYAVLLAEVRQAHLLDRSVRLYVPRLVLVGTMLAVGACLLVRVGNSWWQLAVAAYLAVVFAQLGFLGHDAGHQQITRSRRANARFSLILGNLGIGLSSTWWIDKHNRHHRHPNEVGLDPDIEKNLLSWTGAQARTRRGLPRFVARHQASLFFPLLVLEAVHLHAQSIRTLVRRPRDWLIELALLSVHLVGGVVVLLLVMSPVKALVFLAVQQGLFGVYLGCSFAPNHKGMPLVDSASTPDFLWRQVTTSRNLTGGRAVSAIFGGLDHQIEHHLFPSMPSPNLRRCRPLVHDFCAARDIAYCEASLFTSYARVLHYLRDVRAA